jgi:hypothetical protein
VLPSDFEICSSESQRWIGIFVLVGLFGSRSQTGVEVLPSEAWHTSRVQPSPPPPLGCVREREREREMRLELSLYAHRLQNVAGIFQGT